MEQSLLKSVLEAVEKHPLPSGHPKALSQINNRGCTIRKLLDDVEQLLYAQRSQLFSQPQAQPGLPLHLLEMCIPCVGAVPGG
eukprot:scaffold38_cov415-Prasinococcus_capsulatus_cf.AAC.3